MYLNISESFFWRRLPRWRLTGFIPCGAKCWGGSWSMEVFELVLVLSLSRSSVMTLTWFEHTLQMTSFSLSSPFVFFNILMEETCLSSNVFWPEVFSSATNLALLIGSIVADLRSNEPLSRFAFQIWVPWLWTTSLRWPVWVASTWSNTWTVTDLIVWWWQLKAFF